MIKVQYSDMLTLLETRDKVKELSSAMEKKANASDLAKTNTQLGKLWVG